MRRALAHQVGQPEEPLGACCSARRLSCKRIVIGAGRKLIAEPLQAETGALSHAHYVPLAADGVAERVDAAARIVCHLFHVREYYARSAERTRYDTRFH